MDVVGAAEVAEMLDVELQRISRWRRQEKLPPPYAHLRASPVWLREDIVRFHENPEGPFTTPPDPPTLVGTAEAAAILEMDKASISRWLRADNERIFPEPIARIKAGPIWERDAIEQFKIDHPRRRRKEVA